MVESINWKLKNKCYITEKNWLIDNNKNICIDSKKCLKMVRLAISESYWSAKLAGARRGPSYHHRMTILENTRTAYIYGRHPYLCSKLNHTESKLTGVPPHFFVIVIITVCVCFVVVLAHIYWFLIPFVLSSWSYHII